MESSKQNKDTLPTSEKDTPDITKNLSSWRKWINKTTIPWMLVVILTGIIITDVVSDFYQHRYKHHEGRNYPHTYSHPEEFLFVPHIFDSHWDFWNQEIDSMRKYHNLLMKSLDLRKKIDSQASEKYSSTRIHDMNSLSYSVEASGSTLSGTFSGTNPDFLESIRSSIAAL
jgi:hypothetical protein